MRRRIALTLFALTFLTSVWVMGYRRPPMAAVLLHMLLPWIAVGFSLAFPKWFTTYLDTNDGRLPLSAPWLVHCIALVMLFRCVKFYEWTRVICAASLVGAGLFLIALLAERKLPHGSNLLGLAFVLLFSMGYGYGLVIELNILLDHSPESVTESSVLTKSKEKSYALQIDPWGPVRRIRTVTVPVSVFNSVHEGGRVCMVRREGALGIGWFTAQACPWQGGLVSLASTDILPVFR
jgi:hypothetical protein